MRILYCLCAAALLGTFASPAKAFKFQVLDPPGSIDGIPDWEIDPPIGPISLVPFSSKNCLAYPTLPTGTNCSIVFNESGSAINSLDLVFQSSSLDAPDCGSSVYTTANGGSADADFPGVNCSSSGDTYTLDFYGGNVPSGSVIEFVTDADPSDFPEDLTVIPNTPEPASIWLVSSAAAMLGFLVIGRRRLIHGSSL